MSSLEILSSIRPLNTAYLENKLQVFKIIFAFIAKDSPTDAIKKLTNLNKLASEYIRKQSDSISEYIKGFIAHA